MREREIKIAKSHGVLERCKAFESDLLKTHDIVYDKNDEGVFVDFNDFGKVKQLIVCPKYDIRAEREDYWEARSALRKSVVDLAKTHDLNRTSDMIEDHGEHFYFVFVCGPSWSTRVLLNAEWIEHMNAFRLYKSGEEQNTVAYVDNLSDVDMEKYDIIASED